MRWVQRAWMVAAVAMMAAAGWGCSSAPEGVDDGEVVERPQLDVDEVPEGYEAAEIEGVFASPEGSLVMLSAREGGILLPIFISSGQAFAIELGLRGESFERPLTHDLVANILSDVEVEVAKVHISDFQERTFFATLYLMTPETILQVDARPSDGIVMAAREDLPIYVAQEVLEETGIDPEDIPHMPEQEPGDPDEFRDSPTQTTQYFPPSHR